MPTLDGLEPVSRVVTQMACTEAALRYLGREIEPAWLYGTSGHAFVIHIPDGLCPSGPHTWNGWSTLNGLEADVGCELEHFGPFYREEDPDYDAHREQAWEFTCEAIAEGTPVYGYDFDMGEFYLIRACEDGAYQYFTVGPGPAGEASLPKDRLGDTGVVPMILMTRVRASEPADDLTALRDAMRFGIEFAEGGRETDSPKTSSGLAAYDRWINELQAGEPNPVGQAYNARVWQECREMASEFLRAAKDRIEDDPMELFLAIDAYDRCADELQRVCDELPFPSEENPNPLRDEMHRRTAIMSLEEARDAERDGVKALRKVLEALGQGDGDSRAGS